MRRPPLGLAMMLTALGAATGVSEGNAAEAEANDYGTRRTLEVGGGVDVNWTREVFTVGLTPEVGYFVYDRVELSARLVGTYQNVAQTDGTRQARTIGAVVLEPSYHVPIKDRLFVFFGVGAGIAYDARHPQLDILPRVGLNILVGRAAVLSPAVRTPILVGRNRGPTDDEVGVVAGLAFEGDLTVVF